MFFKLVYLRSVFLISFLLFCFCACGIKSKPLPPETNQPTDQQKTEKK